jgi:hypothetical protein
MMARLRYSLEEAKQAATQIAIEAIGMVETDYPARLISVAPDRAARQGLASKHPTRWMAVFVCHDPEMVLDGGETFVSVDLETRTGEILS